MKRAIVWLLVALTLLVSLTLSAQNAPSLPDGVIASLGGGSPNAIAMSPDGRHLAVATASGIELRSTDTWLIDRLLSCDEGIAVSVAFSPDGAFVAAGSCDRLARVWRAEDGELQYALPNEGDSATAVAFSSDGAILATGSSWCPVTLWSMESGAQLLSLKPPRISTLWRSDVTCLAFSPDDLVLAVGYADSTVRLWDVAMAEVVTVIHSIAGPPRNVAFTQSGDQIMVGSLDGSVRFWGVSSGELVRSIIGPEDGVTVVAVDPSGTLLASGSENGSITLRRFSDDGIIWQVDAHWGPIESLDFSPDGGTLVSLGEDARVRIWTTGNGSLVEELRDYGGLNTSLLFSADGRYLIADVSTVGLFDVWDLSTLRNVRSVVLPSSSGIGRPLASSPDGFRIATGTGIGHREGTTHVWDIDSGAEAFASTSPDHEVQAVAFSPNGELLAIASSDRPGIGVIRWDASLELRSAQTGDLIWSIENDHTKARFLLFTGDSSILISKVGDAVGIRDVKSGKLLRNIEVDARAAALTYDSQMLLTATWTHSALVVQHHRLATGQVIDEFAHDVYSVDVAAFSGDGRLLATSSLDGILRLWSTDSGELLLASEPYLGRSESCFGGYLSRATSLAFSPDGGTLAFGSMDGAILLLDVTKYVTAEDPSYALTLWPYGAIAWSGME